MTAGPAGGTFPTVEMSLPRNLCRTTTAALLAGMALQVGAEPWPAYRGPTGDGVCHEPIRTDWPPEGPPLLWRRPLTDGFGSVTVADGRVYTLIRQREPEDREMCVALDVGTGEELWRTDVGEAWYDAGPAGASQGSDGPRSTPVYANGRLYIWGSHLLFSCLDAATGEVLWRRDFKQEFNAGEPPWHQAASPVVMDGLVLINVRVAGRCLMALDPEDGSIRWSHGNYLSTHATPVPVEWNGQRQMVVLTTRRLAGIEPATGRVLWSHDLTMNTISVAASPVICGNRVYVSAGYSTGAAVVEVNPTGDGWTTTRLWGLKRSLVNHWSTPVEKDGFLYGHYGFKKYTTAPLCCVEAATGEIRWRQDGFGQSGLIRVGDRLLAMTATGEAVLIEANPDAYRELARFRAIQNGVVWNVPAISDGRLFVRSTREIAVYDVAPPPPPRLILKAGRAFGNRLRLTVERADGQPLDADLAGRVELRWSEDLGQPPDQWEVAPPSLLWLNGVLLYEEEIPAGAGSRFYRVVVP
ncbi:MAG: alcohol dehydrogenase [Verrucomicrobia bacterium]|nr:MAG: alcohol dehydrogenase [Verrucomicrobiota bacterium]